MFSCTSQWWLCRERNRTMWKMLMFLVLSLVLVHGAGSQDTCSASTRFTCNDGTCISRAKVCNGKRDCIEGEDESQCDGQRKCLPRDENMARLNGYSCSIPCQKHSIRCQKRSRCTCDDECGTSCINRRTRCMKDPPTVEHSVIGYVIRPSKRRRSVISRQPYHYGDVANYLCEEGTTLRGPLPRCQGTGKWSAEVPKCVGVQEVQQEKRRMVLKELGWFEMSNGYLYRFFRPLKTWVQGKADCQKYGGILASVGIRDPGVRADLRIRLNGFAFWIGLTDIDREGIWMWEDGVQSDGTDLVWRTNGPDNLEGNEDCGVMFYDAGIYKVNDENCRSPRGLAYLCEISP